MIIFGPGFKKPILPEINGYYFHQVLFSIQLEMGEILVNALKKYFCEHDFLCTWYSLR